MRRDGLRAAARNALDNGWKWGRKERRLGRHCGVSRSFEADNVVTSPAGVQSKRINEQLAEIDAAISDSQSTHVFDA